MSDPPTPEALAQELIRVATLADGHTILPVVAEAIREERTAAEERGYGHGRAQALEDARRAACSGTCGLEDGYECWACRQIDALALPDASQPASAPGGASACACGKITNLTVSVGPDAWRAVYFDGAWHCPAGCSRTLEASQPVRAAALKWSDIGFGQSIVYVGGELSLRAEDARDPFVHVRVGRDGNLAAAKAECERIARAAGLLAQSVMTAAGGNIPPPALRDRDELWCRAIVRHLTPEQTRDVTATFIASRPEGDATPEEPTAAVVESPSFAECLRATWNEVDRLAEWLRELGHPMQDCTLDVLDNARAVLDLYDGAADARAAYDKGAIRQQDPTVAGQLLDEAAKRGGSR